MFQDRDWTITPWMIMFLIALAQITVKVNRHK